MAPPTSFIRVLPTLQSRNFTRPCSNCGQKARIYYHDGGKLVLDFCILCPNEKAELLDGHAPLVKDTMNFDNLDTAAQGDQQRNDSVQDSSSQPVPLDPPSTTLSGFQFVSAGASSTPPIPRPIPFEVPQSSSTGRKRPPTETYGHKIFQGSISMVSNSGRRHSHGTNTPLDSETEQPCTTNHPQDSQSAVNTTDEDLLQAEDQGTDSACLENLSFQELLQFPGTPPPPDLTPGSPLALFEFPVELDEPSSGANVDINMTDDMTNSNIQVLMATGLTGDLAVDMVDAPGSDTAANTS